MRSRGWSGRGCTPTRVRSARPAAKGDVAPSAGSSAPLLARPDVVRVAQETFSMETKTDVIYCRYSSELQRAESITDQERRCRDHLDRQGIQHSHFKVIADEAISGTLESRPGFDRLKAL